MNTVNIQEVLSSYKEILGDGCDEYISQDELEALGRVTGKMHYLNYFGFLINIVKYIENKDKSSVETCMKIKLHEQWYDEVKAKNDRLVAINNELSEKIRSLEGLISTYNKCYVQQAKMKNGKKIAYKDQASVEEVVKLKNEGLTNDEIAEKLGVSKSTVYRRLKEHV